MHSTAVPQNAMEAKGCSRGLVMSRENALYFACAYIEFGRASQSNKMSELFATKWHG